MTTKKAPNDTDRIDAIIVVLAANGLSLPESLGGAPAASEELAPKPEAAPADAG